MKKKVGDKIIARDNETGDIILNPTIKKIATLRTSGGFEPAIMLVQHEDGGKDLYFPYWKKTRRGYQGFANRPPMYSEDIFSKLITDAIRKNFFSKRFIRKLKKEIDNI